MYRVKFVDWSETKRGQNPDLLMVLEVEGDTRTEVLYNLLTENWTQEGDFIIEDYELESVITTMVFDLCDSPNKEAEYKLLCHSQFNLTLDPILKSSKKGISAEEILGYFCGSVKGSWEYDNDTLSIDYEIKQI